MALDLNDPEVKEAVTAAAAELAKEQGGNPAELAALKQSIEALEGNNAKLVTEKKAEHDLAKTLREKIEGLGGDDEIAKLQEARSQADKAAALQQLVDGNFEEFTAAITEKAVAKLTKELTDATGQVEMANDATAAVTAKYHAKLVDIMVRDAAAKASVHATAIEDIVSRAQATFSVHEDAVGVFDENGLAKVGSDGKASYSPAEWLEEQRETAPHWWPASQGGGAGGSQGGGQGSGSGNPWAAASWNMTEQGRVVREQGIERAESLAKAAGSRVGASQPSRAA
jgi:hypothetical protein